MIGNTDPNINFEHRIERQTSMLSQLERYIYICEIGVSTYRNFFGAPKGLELFSALKKLHEEDKIEAFVTGNTRIAVSDIKTYKDHTVLLIRLSDPSIPDNILENEKDFSLRTSERKAGEAPAVSAHVVIDLAAKHDGASAYPAAIENVDHISITAISNYLNSVIATNFTRTLERTLPKSHKVVKSEYRPKISIRGHQSKTISNVLKEGGVLQGMTFETSVETDGGFGEGAYGVTKTSAVSLKVSGRPTGNVALDWAANKYREIRGFGLKKAKILIENRHGRSKTVPVNIKQDAIGENFFILQELLGSFDKALRACEAEVRQDMVSKMIEKMPK